MTDITLGSAGNAERMAFLFDTTRLKPSGLACELVVPPEWLEQMISPDALRGELPGRRHDLHPGHPACDLWRYV